MGSGLNTLSRFPYDDWARVKWNDCNGVDCSDFGTYDDGSEDVLDCHHP